MYTFDTLENSGYKLVHPHCESVKKNHYCLIASIITPAHPGSV